MDDNRAVSSGVLASSTPPFLFRECLARVTPGCRRRLQSEPERWNAGTARELYLRGERLSVYLHPIRAGYFLLLAVDARSNLGQARLYGRDAAHKLEASL